MKADTDNGYTRIANTLLETICGLEATARQLRVVWAVVRKTYGYQKKSDWITATQIAEVINYKSDPANIRRDLAELKRRKIVSVDGQKIGINTVVSEWELECRKQHSVENDTCRKQHGGVSKSTRGCVENNTESVSKSTHTKEKKEIYTKETNTKEKVGQSPTFDEVVNLYHELLPMLPRVKKLTDKRKRQIRARIQSDDIPTIEDWRDYFEFIGKSQFLTGKTEPPPGRRRFIADLEWITSESNYVKIYEGNYHRG